MIDRLLKGKSRLLVFSLAALTIFVASFGGGKRGIKEEFFQDYTSIELNKKTIDSPIKVAIFNLNNLNSDYLHIGIYFELEPGWYLYWLNPGEAGLAPQIEWDLPPGFTVLGLDFPAPSKFLSSGYLVYGYKEELLLVSRIAKPKNLSISADRPVIFKAKVNWMVCRESCLVGEKELVLNLSLTDLEEREKVKSIWNRFKDKFPKPAEEINIFLKEKRVIKIDPSNPLSEIHLYLKLGGPDISRIIDFYPLPINDFIIGAEKTRFRNGLIELYLKPVSNEAKIETIKGLLISQEKTYFIEFPLNQ